MEEENKKKNVKDNFSDALQFFGPKVVAFMIGSAIGGGKGGLQGMDVEEKLSSGYRQFKKDRDPASDNLTKYQKGSLGLRREELTLSEKRLEMTGGRMKRIQRQFLTTVARDFDKDKTVSGAREGIHALRGALKHLNTPNQITDNAMKRIAARVIGGEVGVMTDRDVNDFAGNPAFIAQFKQWKERYLGPGGLTDDNRRLFRESFHKSLEIEKTLLDRGKMRFVQERSDAGTDFRKLMTRRFLNQEEHFPNLAIQKNELPSGTLKKEIGKPYKYRDNLKRAIIGGDVQDFMLKDINKDEELNQLYLETQKNKQGQ